MKITREILHNYPKTFCPEAKKDSIRYLDDLVQKRDWDIVELIEQCRKDLGTPYGPPRLLWHYIDNKDTFTKVVEYYIERPDMIKSIGEFPSILRRTTDKLGFSMSTYFQNDAKMFEKVLRYFINNEINTEFNDWTDVFEWCDLLLCDNIELFQDMVKYCIKTRYNFFLCFRYCESAFEKNLDLFKALVEVLTEPNNRSKSANSHWINLAYSKCIAKFPVLHEYVKQTLKDY